MRRFHLPTIPSLAAYLLSPLLVAVTTALLYHLQCSNQHPSSGDAIRPFGIGFLITVALLTALGGRGPGFVTLGLSALSLAYALTPRAFVWGIAQAHNWTELFFVVGVGSILVLGLEAMQTNAHLLLKSEAATARLRAVMDTAPVGVMLSDLSGKLTYANREAERIWGRPLAAVGPEGWSRYQTLNADGSRTLPEHTGLAQVLAGRPGVVQHERLIEHPDGTRVSVSAASTLVRDEAGLALNGLVVFSDSTERKQAETEIAQLLADVQARAEREALVNKIGQVQRRSFDPDAVQREAVRALGESLKTDRCFFTLFDPEQDDVWIGEDWHREDLESLSGDYALSEFRVSLNELYRTGETLIVEDSDQTALSDFIKTAMSQLGIRSGIGVPLFQGGRLAASLSVVMVDTARVWTASEVALAEAVAVQTRAAVEAARLQQREHTIAILLQDALMPATPKNVPGLTMASYYKAALEEASVGGDFIDVFPLDSRRVVFAVGDLSGKGLAAAAQVATVRNMLRYSLYRNCRLQEALAELNTTIVRHDLLTGFATLFVGIYEASLGHLTYASCGHDPSLLRRAINGCVELLPEQGININPVLGLTENSEFTQQETYLNLGDALLLCTDGVTEAGRARGEFLGVAGVAEMLRAGPAGETVEDLVARMVSGVRAYAHGIQHDDVCILAAITG